jgi:hypothetical protein
MPDSCNNTCTMFNLVWPHRDSFEVQLSTSLRSQNVQSSRPSPPFSDNTMEGLLDQVSKHFASLMSLLQEEISRQTPPIEAGSDELLRGPGLQLRRPSEARIAQKLQRLSVPNDLAEEFAAVHCGGAAELAREYEDIYSDARTKFIRSGCIAERLERNLLKLRSHLRTSYRNILSSRVKDLQSRLSEHYLSGGDLQESQRVPFNSVCCIPFFV